MKNALALYGERRLNTYTKGEKKYEEKSQGLRIDTRRVGGVRSCAVDGVRIYDIRYIHGSRLYRKRMDGGGIVAYQRRYAGVYVARKCERLLVFVCISFAEEKAYAKI